MKVKRVISALLCSGMLMLSVMSVSAEACSHVNTTTTLSDLKCESMGSDNHKIYYNSSTKCKDCGGTVSNGEVIISIESHSRVTVADLGHVGAFSHKYRTECTKCGYSVDVIVPCGGH